MENTTEKIRAIIKGAKRETLEQFVEDVASFLYASAFNPEGAPITWDMDKEWDREIIGMISDMLPGGIRAAVIAETVARENGEKT